MLAVCPGLSILTTSRVPLRLRAEHHFPLGPLPLPNGSTQPGKSPALALFVERARAVRADAVQTDRALADAAAICRRLDGLPLAIELAAARCKLLSPGAILARLTNRLQVLNGGPRDLPARQQTMRDTISWSYHLLGPADQATFRRLAVFPASFSLVVAEQLLGEESGASDPPSIVEAIATLVDHGLLVIAREAEDEPRLRILQPIRDVAWTLLTESGECEASSAAHARIFAGIADEIRSGLTGPAPGIASARCEQELPNLMAAIDWFIASGDAEGALTVAGSIWRFWYASGRFAEGLIALQHSLAVSGAPPPARRANALNGVGAHFSAVGEFDAALAAYDEAIPLWIEDGDQRGLATTLSNRALLLLDRARFPEAIAGFEQALALFIALGDEWRTAAVLDNIGLALLTTGDHGRAIDCHTRALATRRALGDEVGLATSLHATPTRALRLYGDRLQGGGRSGNLRTK